LLKSFGRSGGRQINVIAGYQGGNEIDLAVEKGEIQCRSLSAEAYFPANRSSLGVKKAVRNWCKAVK
jgi:hypothetical protein